MTTNPRTEALRLVRVTVSQDDITLLKNINLNIFSGETYGIIAFNNLGVDKLIQLMQQNISLDYGSVYLREKLINNHLYSDESKTGVSIISRQSKLVEDLTVLDNIYILSHDFSKHLITQRLEKQYATNFKQVVEKVGININPYALVKDLSLLQRCVVALIKAIIADAPVIICDHLSNFLGTNDLLRFSLLMDHYKREGYTFLYVCAHHEESFKVCDNIALLENGSIIKKLNKSNMTDNLLNKYTNIIYNRSSHQLPAGSQLLTCLPNTVENSTYGCFCFAMNKLNIGSIKDFSLTIHKGECITLLDKDNHTLDSISRIALCPEKYADYLEGSREIAYINENPTKNLLFYDMSYIDNLCFTKGNEYPQVWTTRKFKKSIMIEYQKELGDDIFCENIVNLSPASLYNLVYYRAITQNAQVVFIKQPFAGADMLLRNHILSLINRLKSCGIAVLILAVSLSDSLCVSDKLIVIEENEALTTYNKSQFKTIRENLLSPN